MRIVHASHGKFHHHDLARQLNARGMLERFFTGYPHWKLRHEDLPHKRISTFPWVEVPYMALLKTPLMRGAFQREVHRLLLDSFDRYVARKIPECDAFIGLSGAGLRSGGTVQRRGGLYACDRGSSHIVTQDRLLREEYARQGGAFRGIDPRMLEREQTEYHQADVIMVPSEFARKTFLGQGIPAGKIAKVPYGVDLERFQKIGDPSSNYFDVVFVGSVTFRKGVPDLLEAFRKFQHPRKRLTIVGPMGEEMRVYLARHPPPGNVICLGHCPQPKLKEILSRSHIMVLPSIEDGFGLVMAQALACGCPVIASENTGARELFADGEHGFIVPIRAPAAIAERLQCLVDDPDLRVRMSVAGQALIRVRMGGWETYGRCIIAEIAQRLRAKCG